MSAQRRNIDGTSHRTFRLWGRYLHLPNNKMSSWYSIFDLFRTVVDISISGIFSARVDHRTLQAVELQRDEWPSMPVGGAPSPADGPIPPSVSESKSAFAARPQFFDYSGSSDAAFWFDFAADVGDGFHSTYYVAALLSQPTLFPLTSDPAPFPGDSSSAPASGTTDDLQAVKHGLPRGRFLLLGGDEVYPSASRASYEQRFVRVYEAAAFTEDPPDRMSAHHLYALPGNHDWYDGLASFMAVFAEQRAIGDFRTQQRSSYFAIKLPHGVWIFAVDIGLAGELDRRQVDHFQELARNHLVDGDRIILSIAEPDWVKARPNIENLRDGLFYFERKLAEALTTESSADTTEKAEGDSAPALRQRRDVRVVLRLAGDLHHYRRHTSSEPLHPTDQDAQKGTYVPRSYRAVENITAGGGGAFLHPTHEVDEDRRNLGKLPDGSIQQYPPGLYREEQAPESKKEARGESQHRAASSSEHTQGITFEFQKAFPCIAESRKITLKNLAFGHYNPLMTISLWILYTLLLNAGLFLRTIGHNAWLVVLWVGVLAVLVIGTRGYARSEASGEIGESKQGRTREIYRRASRIDKAGYSGIWHGIAHVFSLGGVFAGLLAIHNRMSCAIACQTWPFEPNTILLDWVHLPDFGSMSRFLLSSVAGGVAALVSTVIFGLYLYFALNHSKLKLHANGAFASLRIADYKNFLRIRITADGITVFPIGIREVPKEWELCVPPVQPSATRAAQGSQNNKEDFQRSLFYPIPEKGRATKLRQSWYRRLTQSTPNSEPFLIEGPVFIPKDG